MPVIGSLDAGSESARAPITAAFCQSLGEQSYIEGLNARPVSPRQRGPAWKVVMKRTQILLATGAVLALGAALAGAAFAQSRVQVPKFQTKANQPTFKQKGSQSLRRPLRS